MIMRREKALNVFLFFLLQAMLFVSLFPIYFSVDKIHIRTVSLPERMFSMVFVLMWLSLCVYSAWKKRLSLVVGGMMYSILAYLPGWFLPGIVSAAGSVKKQTVVSSFFVLFFNKMYELVSAPLAGVSLLVSGKASTSLSRWLLPVLLLSYAGTFLFRFYRNAYLAEQLHLDETAYISNPALARELAVAPGGGVAFYASSEEMDVPITVEIPDTSVPVKAIPESAAPARPLRARAIPARPKPKKLPASSEAVQNIPAEETDANEVTRRHTPRLPK